MKAIRILNPVFQTNGWGASEQVLAGGQVLPADDETALRQLALRNAEEVDVPDPAPEAPAADAASAAEEEAGDATAAVPQTRARKPRAA